MSAPLDGIVVIALEQAVAAPFATRQLADLGATVIKIERPDGGDFARDYNSDMNGQSTYFVWANAGKQSLVLDLKVAAERDQLEALIAGADVFIVNMSASATERAGLDAQSLHTRYPSLIACEVTGYGRGGPRSDDKAYDLAIQAEGGVMSTTGSEAEMSKAGFAAADIASAMYATSAILAALYRRSQTGEGAAISISMLEALTQWTAVPIYAEAYTGVAAPRVGHRHASIAPYGLYPLADGSRVLIAVQSNRDWATFATAVLGQPELVNDERFVTNADRIAHVDELETILTTVFTAAEPDEIVARLTAAQVVWARAREPRQVWEHEQLAARDRFETISTTTGDVTALRSALNISDVPPSSRRVPALGEHDPAVIESVIARGSHSPPAD